MPIENFSRSIPGGLTESLGGLRLDVAVDGGAGTPPKVPAGFGFGYQCVPQKIAALVSSTPSYYPNDGSGTIVAAASAGDETVSLSATVLQSQHSSLTAVGMLLACRYATVNGGAWEWAPVARYTPGVTPSVQLARPLTNNWPSGAKVHLLFDTRFAEDMQIIAEVSGATTEAEITAIMFPWPDSAKKMMRVWDQGDFSIESTGEQGSDGTIQESGYYFTRARKRDVRGYLGAKLRLASIQNGTVSLWLGRI